MKNTVLITGALPSILVTLATLPALAQNADASSSEDRPVAAASGVDHPVAPIKRAFEIGFAPGYTQGVGTIAKGGASIQDVAGPGGAFDLRLGYRMTRHLAFGLYGSYARYSNADLPSGYDVQGASAGIYGDWHFRPDRSIDPWLGVGSGWRGLFFTPDVGESTSIMGWQILRVQGGVDYRVTPEVALGPVLAASVNSFFGKNDAGTTGFVDIHQPRANFSFFAGFQGRFDLFGQREEAASASASRRAVARR